MNAFVRHHPTPTIKYNTICQVSKLSVDSKTTIELMLSMPLVAVLQENFPNRISCIEGPIKMGCLF